MFGNGALIGIKRIITRSLHEVTHLDPRLVRLVSFVAADGIGAPATRGLLLVNDVSQIRETMTWGFASFERRKVPRRRQSNQKKRLRTTPMRPAPVNAYLFKNRRCSNA